MLKRIFRPERFGRSLAAGRMPPFALLLWCLPVLVVLRKRYAKHNEGKGRNDCCRCRDCSVTRRLVFDFWSAEIRKHNYARWRQARISAKMFFVNFAFGPIQDHVALSGYHEPKEKLFKNLTVGGSDGG